MSSEPDFTLGIEQEYLRVDPATGDLAPTPDALDSQPQIARTRAMAEDGRSVARQRAVLDRAMAAGATRDEPMTELVRHLIAEFRHGL